MPEMTFQEMYDKAKAQVAEFGQSSDERGNCRYRMPDGRRCAVGVLIPDEFYDFRAEGAGLRGVVGGLKFWEVKNELDQGVGALPLVKMLNRSGIPTSARNFLADLQNAHDALPDSPGVYYYPIPREFVLAKMAQVALDYGLIP